MNGESAELIPVRALNQVSYCPRLYYLEYVDAVMPLNEHVEDGLFQHRRVNDPSLANRTRKEGDALRTRSVSLSSARLGISGKLDLLEEKGESVRPVEYKRSSAPRDEDGEPTCWENDAVQLCAQGMLIEEEFGADVPGGVLYYIGSKERVDVPFGAAMRAKTLAAIELTRELSAREVAPEPLPAELRHRCFGCSLAPVCLPEETLYLIHQPEPEPSADGTRPDEPAEPPSLGASLARVIPASDDKAVLYLHEPGSHVGRRSAHLVVSLRGREVNKVPIATIRQVVVFGNVQVSTQALHTLAEAEIPVSFLSGHGKFIAAVNAPLDKNMALRAAQYRAFSDPERALGLSRAVVAAKIANQRTLLMRSLRGIRDEPATEPGSSPPDGSVSPAVEVAADRDRIRGRDEPAARNMAELIDRVPDRARPRGPAGAGGPGGGPVLRQLRADAQGPFARGRVRLHGEEPPPAPRPGQLPARFRLRDPGEGLLLGRLHRRLRPVHGLLPRRPARPPVAGPGPDGGVPARHRGFGRAELDQQRDADDRRLPDLARRLPAHRRRPRGLLPGVRAAEVRPR